MFIIHTCFGEALISLIKKNQKKQQHFRLENIDCTKYQLIVVIADEILSKTFFSS